MHKDSVARRYSGALFSLATDDGCVSDTVATLEAFIGMLDRDPLIDEFFSSPVVDRELKLSVICDALAGKASDLVVNFLVLLVRKRRETLVRLIASQLHELYDSAAGRAPAALQTARALQAHELQSLGRQLSSVYGWTLMPQADVAPELLGGMTLQVGDRYVDASVSGRLEDLRRQMLAGADVWTTQSQN
ncbi:MAG: ATP synthase F1 subunit delta [Candidatus Eremiobacteraeota bacterium]|nr:ATP synthase F1 subunit delta [Candidatus Eremiobacteraeota bacterium]